MRLIDSIIDRLSMYRLLVYYLGGLLGVSAGLSVAGVLSFNVGALALSVVVLISACLILNRLMGYMYDVPSSDESAIITALILALIITPMLSLAGIVFLLVVSGLAMASKYVLAMRQQHVFNPAAIAVLLTAVAGGESASWWVGAATLTPLVIVGGLVITRKVRREYMLMSYVGAALAATVIVALIGNQAVSESLRHMLVGSAFWFLGFVMLTEPFTSPTSLRQSMWYGGLVGALLPPPLHVLGFYSSPEAALSVGNVLTRFVTPPSRRALRLVATEQIARDTFDFVFALERPLQYAPGQYIELTVPHTNPDSRGTRRYLTLASSPTEETLRVGMKCVSDGSSYKAALLQLQPNTPLYAAQLSGDFVLPSDRDQKLLFIAGGIGITPFRSMIKYLLDRHEYRDVVLLYAARSAADIAYAPLFAEANRIFGLKVIYILGDNGPITPHPWVRAHSRIDASVLQAEVPDLAERMCYISGTHAMTTDLGDALQQLGVREASIKTDFFPGYM